MATRAQGDLLRPFDPRFTVRTYGRVELAVGIGDVRLDLDRVPSLAA